MLQVLDAAAVLAWCAAGRDALSTACAEIDDLNVFPVPDRDTGTNLLLTVESVLAAVRAAPDDEPSLAAALGRGGLLGARGNSGVLLSQLLRAVADALAAGPLDGPALAAALVRGAELAHAAVARPVEGTLLTVARVAGERALTAAPGGLGAVVAAALGGARVGLAGTTAQLPALHAAGVVDAGGRGWVVLLEALHAVVSGSAADAGRAVPPPPGVPAQVVPRERWAAVVAREQGSEEYAYEVQYLLRGAGEEAVDRLRAVLGALGDSLVVVGQDGLHNVHVHVNDIGAAVEAGLDAGRPFRLTVTRFADQVEGVGGNGASPRSAAPADPGPAAPHRAVVAVAAGSGLARLLHGAGAVVVDAGPPAPSPARLLAAVRQTGAAQVVLLPDDARLLEVAGTAAAAARADGTEVAVVPTVSVLQALAALAVSDPGRPLDADVAAMTAASAATRSAEVTRAVAGATTSAGTCLPGDLLGLLDGTVAVVGAELEWVARRLLDRLVGGAELVTVVLGAGTGAQVGERLRAHVAERWPGVEVAVVDGGDPHRALLIGAE